MKKFRIMIIDGQGGRIGKMLVNGLIPFISPDDLIVVGTNSVATTTMLKANAVHGATGENALIVNSRGADIIVGPIGIIMADSLLGEVTAAMATAVSQSQAKKILLPMNNCKAFVVGITDQPIAQLVQQAIQQIKTELM